MPLLEEAMVARSSLGRDDYDAKRWRDEGKDIREEIASSRSVVINATDGTAVPQETAPAVNLPTMPPQTNTGGAATSPAVLQPVNMQSNSPGANVPTDVTKPVEQPQQNLPIAEANNKPSETQLASTKPIVEPQQKQAAEEVRRPRVNPDAGKEALKTPNQTEEKQDSSNGNPVDVGSLIDYATSKSTPAYPSAARTMRASGVVRVDVVIDENGDVAEVKKANGHALLQAAAKDAIRRWKFRPVTQNGQPVRASGYVNFNFAL
jgi:protein TonB